MESRLLKFLIGCIGFRFLLTAIAAKSPKVLPLMGKIAIIPCIGFITIYFFGLRQRGLEVNGELIWWNHLRPLHSMLWGLFAYFAIHKNPNSWMILFVDTLIGLFAFLFHYKLI